MTREVSAADENPTTVRVAVPSYVETIGETLARVSEALRDDGVSGATCVSLHATGDDGVGEEDAATGFEPPRMVDGGRYRVRCADDLSVNDDDTSAAARKRRDEDASFEVDVAPREDPTREGATIRLPGARALSKMAREDVCERVRVAVGASTDAGDAGNAEMGLYRFDGSVIERPEEITPGMRLLYGEASADEGLPKAVVATATEVFEASASREAPKKSRQVAHVDGRQVRGRFASRGADVHAEDARDDHDDDRDAADARAEGGVASPASQRAPAHAAHARVDDGDHKEESLAHGGGAREPFRGGGGVKRGGRGGGRRRDEPGSRSIEKNPDASQSQVPGENQGYHARLPVNEREGESGDATARASRLVVVRPSQKRRSFESFPRRRVVGSRPPVSSLAARRWNS